MRRSPGEAWLTVRDAHEHNLQHIDVDIPLGCFVAVTGVSGSGKSTLVSDILHPALMQKIYRSKNVPGRHKAIEGVEHIDKVINIDQSPIGRTPRSNPATYTGVFDKIRTLFASTQEAKVRGYLPGRFSFNVKGGRCEACAGDGTIKIEMHFLPDVYVPCEVCKGARYNRDTLDITFKGKNIAEVLDLSIEEGLEFFANQPTIARHLQTLVDVGLGYVRLGQPAPTLSGGEAQRVKLSSELGKRSTGRTLYILDEPTTGLHFEDVRKLLGVLLRLVEAGNTVLVIEHNLDVIKTADWIIDLGPEGGDGGGRVIVEGSPEQVAKTPESHTGRFLAPDPRHQLTRARLARSLQQGRRAGRSHRHGADRGAGAVRRGPVTPRSARRSGATVAPGAPARDPDRRVAGHRARAPGPHDVVRRAAGVEHRPRQPLARRPVHEPALRGAPDPLVPAALRVDPLHRQPALDAGRAVGRRHRDVRAGAVPGPFSVPMRVAVIAGYCFAFEYGVITRSYGLSALLRDRGAGAARAAAAVVGVGRHMLVLLAWTSLPGAVLAIAVAVAVAWVLRAHFVFAGTVLAAAAVVGVHVHPAERLQQLRARPRRLGVEVRRRRAGAPGECGGRRVAGPGPDPGERGGVELERARPVPRWRVARGAARGRAVRRDPARAPRLGVRAGAVVDRIARVRDVLRDRDAARAGALRRVPVPAVPRVRVALVRAAGA